MSGSTSNYDSVHVVGLYTLLVGRVFFLSDVPDRTYTVVHTQRLFCFRSCGSSSVFHPTFSPIGENVG